MARQASYNRGYEIREEGDRRIVSFRGDGLPWSAWVIFPFAFLTTAWLLATPFWIVPVAFVLVIGSMIYLAFQRQEFILTPTSVIKAGTEYEASRISEILIDNPMNKDVSITASPGLVVGGTGIVGASVAATATVANAATHTMAHMAAANARAAAKRRFRVRIRYGAKVITLARNLKEDHAVSIFELLTAE